MKKYYHIKLMPGNNDIAGELCKLAARSNGGKYLTLQEMESFAKIQCIQYPSLNDNITISVVGNTLLVDKKTECVLIIEERETLEIEMPIVTSEEATQILNEIRNEAPTLN